MTAATFHRLAAIVLGGMTLAGCAEVTRFHTADGGTLYHIDCTSTFPAFESCQSAAERLCPNGHDTAPYLTLAVREQNAPFRTRDDGSFIRCR